MVRRVSFRGKNMSDVIKSAGSAAFAFALACGLIAVTVAEPAAASTVVADQVMDREIRSESVSLAGLDLSSPKDIRLLETRIRAASRRVCRQPGNEPLTSQQAQDCRKSAKLAAQSKVAALLERNAVLAEARPVLGQTVLADARSRN
jgi:UrcA family protein